MPDLVIPDFDIDDETKAKLIAIDDAAWYSQNRKRALKLALLAEFEICFWCGVEVKDYGTIPPNTPNPPDMATVDHLISRLQRRDGERVLKVLACSACNGERSKEECQAYPNHENRHTLHA